MLRALALRSGCSYRLHFALAATKDDLERLRRHNAYLAWLKSTLESSRGKAAAPATAPLAVVVAGARASFRELGPV